MTRGLYTGAPLPFISQARLSEAARAGARLLPHEGRVNGLETWRGISTASLRLSRTEKPICRLPALPQGHAGQQRDHLEQPTQTSCPVL